MQLQYCIKTFLRIGKCLLPSEGRFCSIDQDREKGASQSCLGGAGPQHEALAVCSPRRMYTPCMAEGRKGLRWWALKAQSPSQMAVKGHNCTPLPSSWRPKPHHQCHLGGSLPQPVTSQPTFQVLGVPAHHWGLPRHQVHLPVALAWTSASGTCSGLRPLGRLKES